MSLLSFRASSFRFPVATTPRSFLALALSFACVPLGVDLPATAGTPPAAKAMPAAAKDKKQKQDPALKGLPITELSADEAILHALNRLAYGPRPGDIERVKQMGLAKWIEQQLNPNSIDDKAVEARLQDYPTLRMSTAKLIDEYPQPKPAVVQAVRQAQARAQEQQARGRGDAAAAVVEKDMQASQTQGSGGGSETQSGTSSAETAQQSAAENPNAPAPMKEPEMVQDQSPKGARKRDALGGDPNNIPRAVADDSKRPARIAAELAMAKV